jgi:cysteine-rich repeat protein
MSRNVLDYTLLPVVCFLATFAACVSSNTVQCDDGSTCPVGAICAAQTCVSQEQLDACDGKSDGAMCMVGILIRSGTCRDGACLGGICGDGQIDGAEVCDDGNNETCGNGIRDSGEECDDGNFLSNDDCSAQCRLTELFWHAEYGAVGGTDYRQFESVFGGAAALDAARGTIILNGGSRDNKNELSAPVVRHPNRIWTGSRWQAPMRNEVIEGKVFAAMAYDASSRFVVRFGGVNGGPARDDTTIWNGTDWHSAAVPLPLPPKGQQAVMASEPSTGHVVLFIEGETWRGKHGNGQVCKHQ